MVNNKPKTKVQPGQTVPQYDELLQFVQAMKDDFYRAYVQGNRSAMKRLRVHGLIPLRDKSVSLRRELLDMAKQTGVVEDDSTAT